MTSNEEIFDSSIQPDGSLAGVYEQDSESGYFYLYNLRKPEGYKVVAAIHIHSGELAILSGDVRIDWSKKGTAVGLFLKGKLWAAFADTAEYWFIGSEGKNAQSELPFWLRNAFDVDRPH